MNPDQTALIWVHIDCNTVTAAIKLHQLMRKDVTFVLSSGKDVIRFYSGLTI